MWTHSVDREAKELRSTQVHPQATCSHCPVCSGPQVSPQHCPPTGMPKVTPLSRKMGRLHFMGLP